MQSLTGMPQNHIKSENFQSLYINSTMMRISFYDFVILCGKVTDEGSIEDLVSLVMSPEHAKALLEGLTTTVKQYEDTFGVIKTQPKPESIERQ